MDSVKLEALDLSSSNLSESWRRWSQTIKLVLSGPLASKSEDVKCSFFLLFICQEARDVYNTWTLIADERDKTDVLFKKSEEYCKARKNLTVIPHKFNSRVQGVLETADQFITDLKLLSMDCEYGELREEMICDRLVVGVYSEEVKEKLLQQPDLTLQKATEIIKAIEGSKQHVKTIGSEHSLNEVRCKTQKKQVAKQQHKLKQADNSKECTKCGRKHTQGQCPAYGKKCLKCQKRNHFAIMCRSRKTVHAMDNSGESDSSETETVGAHFIGSVHSSNTKDEALLLGKQNCEIKFKLDTGAQVNVIPIKSSDK